jgi:hypothetical protein
MPDIPKFKLSHGQVAWAVSGGREPQQSTLDTLRYLRQVGVPFTDDEQGIGRGRRLAYTFNHLIECALAVYVIQRGAKPRQVAPFLVGDRKTLRKLYGDTYRDLPEAALNADWVKSRGRLRPILNGEQFIRVHERYRDTGGEVEMMTMEEIVSYSASFGDRVERYRDRVFPLVPLKRVMIEAVAWALEAPVTRPGRIAGITKLSASK